MDRKLENTLRRQLWFWTVALAGFMGFLWLFSDILLPFVAGMALAYFLDPVADWFERRGLSRLMATIVILSLFVIVFVLALVVVVPVLGGQLTNFIERAPELLAGLQTLLTSLKETWVGRLFAFEGISLRGGIDQILKQGAGWVTTVLGQIWSSGMALLNVGSLLVVTPVVAFYMLYDWDRMVGKIDSWLPRDHRQTIHDILVDIDTAVAGFVRGQGTLCMILGLFYAVSLTVVGLNFGLLIGLFAGMISFIPFVGSLVGLTLSVGVALVQFWPDWVMIALVALVFGAGQFLEGNILQPKLVGEKVGLHPVWLMFALFAFGSLFGFTGMLVAVPAAAAIGVFVRHGMDWYLKSELYHGDNGVGKAAPQVRKRRTSKSDESEQGASGAGPARQ